MYSIRPHNRPNHCCGTGRPVFRGVLLYPPPSRLLLAVCLWCAAVPKRGVLIRVSSNIQASHIKPPCIATFSPPLIYSCLLLLLLQYGATCTIHHHHHLPPSHLLQLPLVVRAEGLPPLLQLLLRLVAGPLPALHPAARSAEQPLRLLGRDRTRWWDGTGRDGVGWGTGRDGVGWGTGRFRQ